MVPLFGLGKTASAVGVDIRNADWARQSNQSPTVLAVREISTVWHKSPPRVTSKG
jgi:hypothetical protein